MAARWKVTAGLILVSLPVFAQTRGEVQRTSETDFTIKLEIGTSAKPREAFNRLLDVGKWWDPAHTYGGDAHALSLEPRPGGCFCESLPEGGVQHAAVLYLDSGKGLRLSGSLGPLQEYAVQGILEFRFEAAGTGSRILLSYRVAGQLDGGLEPLAPVVDRVLAEQLARLGRLIDTGTPD